MNGGEFAHSLRAGDQHRPPSSIKETMSENIPKATPFQLFMAKIAGVPVIGEREGYVIKGYLYKGSVYVTESYQKAT